MGRLVVPILFLYIGVTWVFAWLRSQVNAKLHGARLAKYGRVGIIGACCASTGAFIRTVGSAWLLKYGKWGAV